jgi:predicted neuraminidase
MSDATPERDIAHLFSLRTEHVFGDLRPFSQCHASTLVALPDRRILVAWFGGTREGHADVGIWAAERTAFGAGSDAPPTRSATTPTARIPSAPGTDWSEPRRIAKVADEPHWNPVLFALSPSGDDLVLHFKVGARIRDWETWMQRSDDAGRTWSAATRLVPGDRGGRGAVRNKPIRLASGDWLAGASLERWRRWDSFIDRSPNGLDAWQASPLIPIDRKRFEGKGLIQPTLWESAPGRVHALFRSTDGRAHRSDSQDGGRSWSSAYPIDLPNNNSGLDVARLRDGTLALACNPVAGNWAARTPLSVLLSKDNGETWPERIDLETDPGEFSYPAIIETEDGLAVSYTWNRRRIALARIVPDTSPGLG